MIWIELSTDADPTRAPTVPWCSSEMWAADIDAIGREVPFTGWADSQPGDRVVRKAVRTVLHKQPCLPLATSSPARVRENY